MGCFNQTAFISNLQLRSGDPAVLIFMVENKYARSNKGHAVYSTDNFQPVFLPVFGEYDEYGTIENIVEDANTKFIEDYFGKSIEEVITDADNLLCGREDSIEAPKNDKMYKTLVFALEHKFVYDEMTKPLYTFMADGNLSQYLIEDILKFEKINIKAHERFNLSYAIPGNDKYYLASDGHWTQIYNAETNKEVTSFGKSSLYGPYHPNQLFGAIEYLTGLDLSDRLPDKYKTCDIYDVMYEVTILKQENIDKKLAEYKAVAEKLKEETDETKDVYLNELRFMLRDGSWGFERWYRGADFIDFSDYREGGTGKVMHLLKENELAFKPEFKDSIIDFLRFNATMSTNSWTYKLSSYGSQETNFKLYLRIYEKYVEHLKEIVERREKEEAGWNNEDDE